jgi:hypothetical protein
MRSIRSIGLAATLAAAMVLGGCNGNGQFDPVNTVVTAVGDLIDKDEKEKMKEMPVEVAVASCNEDPSIFEKSLRPKGSSATNSKEAMLAAAETETREGRLGLEAYKAMIAELESTIRAQLSFIAATEPAAGPDGSYGIVIGTFRNQVPDARWLDGTLDDVALRLASSNALPKSITIVPVGMEEADYLLGKVAEADRYISIDESNVAELRVIKFHPKDVYVLDGSMTMIKDEPNYRVEFRVTATLKHPQSQGMRPSSQQFVRGYLYHPARGEWITEAKNDELRAKYNGQQVAAR